MKINFLVFSLLIFTSLLFGLEVGGHITQDTIWGPENNPYLVTENLYVDNNVTLTVLPGTEIKIKAAPYDVPNAVDLYFIYSPNNHNLAKLIWVNGRIIANGTKENPIIDIGPYEYGAPNLI